MLVKRLSILALGILFVCLVKLYGPQFSLSLSSEQVTWVDSKDTPGDTPSNEGTTRLIVDRRPYKYRTPVDWENRVDVVRTRETLHKSKVDYVYNANLGKLTK